jgi:acyl-CoA dehydrogenase
MAARNGLYRFQQAIGGAIDNFPMLWARILMRVLVFPLGRNFKPAPDYLGHQAVRSVIVPGAVRDRLTRHIYVTRNPNDPTGLLEVAMEKVIAAEEAEKKLERAIRAGKVRRYHGIDWIGDAARQGIITESESIQLREVEALTDRVIAVDHFDPAEVRPHYISLGHNSQSGAKAAAE